MSTHVRSSFYCIKQHNIISFSPYTVNGKHTLIRIQVYVIVWFARIHVREDNPRALASGLSPVHMHSHTLPYCNSMHVHFVHCEIFDVKHIEISLKCAIMV